MTALSTYPRGHRNYPMSDAEIQAKFRSLAGGSIPAEQCDGALSLLGSLERLPSLAELFDALLIPGA